MTFIRARTTRIRRGGTKAACAVPPNSPVHKLKPTDAAHGDFGAFGRRALVAESKTLKSLRLYPVSRASCVCDFSGTLNGPVAIDLPLEAPQGLAGRVDRAGAGGGAGAYLDGLWARADVPTAGLRDAIVGDASLTPLRRLVAAEMLEERLAGRDQAADEAFEQLKKPFEDPGWKPGPQSPEAGAEFAAQPDAESDAAARQAALRAAVASADLPPRVKEAALAKAEAWKYVPPKATADSKPEPQTEPEAKSAPEPTPAPKP